MNRPAPPPLCVPGLWKKEKPLAVILAKSPDVSVEVSQLSVMPRMLIFFLVMRSDSTGALSHIECSLTLPKWSLRTPEPGFRLTSSSSNRRRDMSKFSGTLGGGRIFLFPERKRDGIDSNDGERVRDITSALL